MKSRFQNLSFLLVSYQLLTNFWQNDLREQLEAQQDRCEVTISGFAFFSLVWGLRIVPIVKIRREFVSSLSPSGEPLDLDIHRDENFADKDEALSHPHPLWMIYSILSLLFIRITRQIDQRTKLSSLDKSRTKTVRNQNLGRDSPELGVFVSWSVCPVIRMNRQDEIEQIIHIESRRNGSLLQWERALSLSAKFSSRWMSSWIRLIFHKKLRSNSHCSF